MTFGRMTLPEPIRSSSAWVERIPDTDGVAGSNPASGTIIPAGDGQVGVRLLSYKQAMRRFKSCSPDCTMQGHGGLEQLGQLVGLISQRSKVQILHPLR